MWFRTILVSFFLLFDVTIGQRVSFVWVMLRNRSYFVQ